MVAVEGLAPGVAIAKHWLNAEIDWDTGTGDSLDLPPNLPRFWARYLDAHRQSLSTRPQARQDRSA